MSTEERPDTAEKDAARSTRRDDMDALTRAVSDTLDEYLHRHFGKVTSSTHPEDFLAWLAENGYCVCPIPPGGGA